MPPELSDAVLEGPPGSMVAVGTFVRGGQREGLESATFTVALPDRRVEIPGGLPLHVGNKLVVRAGVIVLPANTRIRIAFSEKSTPGIGPMRGIDKPVIDGDVHLEVPGAPAGKPSAKPPWVASTLGRIAIAVLIVGGLMLYSMFRFGLLTSAHY